MKATLKKLVLGGCILMLFLSCSKEMPITSQQGENTDSSYPLSKKGGGGPSTWIGTATFTDGGINKIWSDDGNPYIDCRNGGEDKVEIELDAKRQLDRVEIFCGQHCQQACYEYENSSRTVSMELFGGEDLVASESTAGKLLAAIKDAENEQVVIQFWPLSKNNWTSLIICIASSVTRDILTNSYYIDPTELNKYKFYGGPENCTLGDGNDRLMFGLKHPSVDVTPNADGSWTIVPLDVPDDPVKLYVMKKNNPKHRFWQPEFLATYEEGLPFQITVTADALL